MALSTYTTVLTGAKRPIYHHTELYGEIDARHPAADFGRAGDRGRGDPRRALGDKNFPARHHRAAAPAPAVSLRLAGSDGCLDRRRCAADRSTLNGIRRRAALDRRHAGLPVRLQRDWQRRRNARETFRLDGARHRRGDGGGGILRHEGVCPCRSFRVHVCLDPLGCPLGCPLAVIVGIRERRSSYAASPQPCGTGGLKLTSIDSSFATCCCVSKSLGRTCGTAMVLLVFGEMVLPP